MKNTPLSICNEFIQPGEKVNLALQMPELYSCAPVYMPLKIIHGKQSGPCLLIFATIDGNEMNGLEIVNRLIESFSADDIKGTLIAVPVINVYGLTHYPKLMPFGNYSISHCFPGKEEGNYGERIAHIFTQELLKKADYCIELDTGAVNQNMLPQVYCNFNDHKTKQMAKAFQAPVITNVRVEDNNLRKTTEELNIPLLVYQAGEAMRFDEHAISLGVFGIQNIMKTINLLEGEPSQDIQPVYSQDEEWFIAHKGGILHAAVELGQTVHKGDRLGTITDPFSADVAESLKATQDGIIVGVNTTPLIHEGLALFKVASFIDYDKAENAIESWEEQVDQES